MKTNFSYNIMFATLITLLLLTLGCNAHNAEAVEGIYEAGAMSNGAEALVYRYEAVQSFSNGAAAVCLAASGALLIRCCSPGQTHHLAKKFENIMEPEQRGQRH